MNDSTRRGNHLARTMSPRHFAFYPTIDAPYTGVEVAVWESSSTDPSVWVAVRPPGAAIETYEPAHLTLEQAELLAEQLLDAVANHWTPRTNRD